MGGLKKNRETVRDMDAFIWSQKSFLVFANGEEQGIPEMGYGSSGILREQKNKKEELRMKKRILSVILVLTMVFSLTACGGDEGKEDTPDTSEGGDTKDDGNATGEKIEKYDSLTPVRMVRIVPNSATQDYQEGEDAENNAWTQLFEEKYNIDLTYDWLAADQADYDSKVNLFLSSGELPDMFSVNATQFAQLRDADLIQPLDEVWEMYASENAKNLIEVEGGEKVIQACTYDDSLMAIPFTGTPKEGVPLLHIRQDWLENLGLSVPETMDDVIEIAEAFASQDPDQNGQDDTYAIAMNSTLYSSDNLAFFYANESYPNNYVMKDGALTNSITDEGTKKTLEMLADWYDKGYIDPEWFTKDLAKSYELISNGKVGIFFGAFSSGLYPLQSQHTLEPDSDWLVMGIPGYDGELITAPYTLGVNSYYVVSKECEHPEALIMMLNEWVDLFYYNTDDDIQLQYINSASGAEIWQNAPVQAYRGLKNMQCGLDITAYYNGELTMEDLTAEERGYVTSIEGYKAGDESLWAWNKIFGVDGAATIVQEYIDADAYIFDENWGTPTEAMTTKGTIINDYMLKTFTSLINGEMSFDDWDSFVEEYKSLGYDEILAELTEWYESQQ